MKKIKYIILSLFAMSALISCEDGDFFLVDQDNDELTGGAALGGLVTLDNSSIGYVVGNDGTYTASGSVYQGKVQTTSVDVYKSYRNSVSNSSSNSELLITVPVTNTTVGQSASFEFSFKYEDLISGLTFNGSPVSTDDTDLNIGDNFILSYVGVTSEGNRHRSSKQTVLTVNSRFAGTYSVGPEKLYYRIGVLRDDVEWPAEMSIESVNATTYRIVEYFGAFDGNVMYFEIDANDRITYPANDPDGNPQLGNGEPLITCDLNSGDLANVPCGLVSNYVERDEVNGEDKLFMTFGYFTAGSGAREFYQVLTKIVE